jgi:hypothetical protein
MKIKETATLKSSTHRFHSIFKMPKATRLFVIRHSIFDIQFASTHRFRSIFKMPKATRLFDIRYSIFICSIFFFVGSLSAQSPAKTIVHGKVIDAKTEEGLPYATVQFNNDPVGTRTDMNGNFYLESSGTPKKVKVSYVGYQPQDLKVQAGTQQTVTVRLVENSMDIKEVTIRPTKYSKRNNPAVDLIEEVFKHKDQNRKEGLDYYSYEQYEKLQFNINGINDKFRKRWYFRKFKFIFDNVDTSKVNNKVALPMYLRERLSKVFYRKNPKDSKEILLAEGQTVLDDDYDVDKDGVSAYLSNLYQEMDIYAPTIGLLNTQFVGPLSGIANTMYRFYIVDTVILENRRYADVFFAPKNKSDLAFMGNMLVALDSTYAVRRVEMGISKEINLNFVTDLHIAQDFEFVGEGANRRLLLARDAVTMDFNIFKKADGRSFLATKTAFYKDYRLNQPIPDSLFRTQQRLQRDTGDITHKSREFWRESRYNPLTKREQGIGEMIDSIQRVRAFRILMEVGTIMTSGYKKFGGVEIGPLATFFSFNDVEGNRFRLGGRTNAKLVKNMIFEGFGAYGSVDRQWKYYGAVTYAFGNRKPRTFPMNQLMFSYRKDLRVPGLDIENWQSDNFLLSFQRGVNNKMVFSRSLRMDYTREFKSGFSFAVTTQHRDLPAAGILRYEYQNPDDPANQNRSLSSFETGFGLRYAPNEKFYQGTTYRLPMLTKFPVLSLSFRMGIKGVAGSQFDYQRITAKLRKTLFVAPLGRSELTLEGGRIFGSLPYPMLEIHRANQSFAYDWYSYNLMNFLEFASDRFGALTLHHNFNGFFLNKVPLVKKLQLREVVSFKALYGKLGSANIPSASNNLVLFPIDDSGNPLIHTLGKQPYMEASIGIANIFQLLRVDYVRRLSYTNLPNVSKWGLRLSFQAGF